jgi:enoyl-CoA hydratase/carnithine racemase
MDILTTTESGLLTLTFNRLSRKNAITAVMYQTLADALVAANDDKTIRAILLTGQPEIFTAGNDLDDFMKNSAPVPGKSPEDAAVSGAAIGIGTTLLLHCDLVYCADNAKFSMPFTQLGLCPEFGSSILFTQLAGYPRAAEKLLLGDAFTAQEAFEMGLVSKVLNADELLPFAQKQAARLIALPAASVRTTKALMRQPRKDATMAAINAENERFGAMLLAPEAKEAFTAFFEKRKPDFSTFD